MGKPTCQFVFGIGQPPTRRIDMKKETELKIAYLAGVLDSDGWFTIHKNSRQGLLSIYSPDIGINQVESEAIMLAQSLFGGTVGIIDFSKQENRFSRKPMYSWKCSAGMQDIVLESLIPHLRIKRKRAEILLRLRKDINFHKKYKDPPLNVVDFRESLYQQLKELSHPPVAETECIDSSREEKRQSDLHGNMQSAAEMTAPTK